MIIESNNDIIDKVLDVEKGLVDNPNDPGGITNCGISFLYLSKKYPDKGYAEIRQIIRDMTPEKARLLYLEDFIAIPKFNFIVDMSVRYIVVDTGINFGPSTAIRYLQKALGVEVDGIMGKVTIGAVNTYNVSDTVRNIIHQRVEHRVERVKEDRRQLDNLMGWLNRDLSFMEYLL